MRTLLVSFFSLLSSFMASGAIVYSQLPANPPSGGIPSQLWFDPAGQNDMGSDATAYDDFTLTKTTTITHVDWWGEAGPSVGFFITFYNQDSHSTAFQPDIVQINGVPPIATETTTNFTQVLVGNGMYLFSADLQTPVTLSANSTANPRYFISIEDSMPTAFATWGWAQGFGGNSRMFYYQYHGSPAGGPYYSRPTLDRAFILRDAIPEMKISRETATSAVISWPTNSAGFSLQQNSVITSGWVTATNAINIVGTNFQATIGQESNACYYRLFRP